MKSIITIIVFFYFGNCISQCTEIEKLKVGYYNLPDQIIDKGNYVTEWFYLDADTTQNCCDIKKVEKFTAPILSKVKSQIINRSNESFFNNLELEYLIVYYYDFKSLNNFDNIKFQLDKVGNINFKISYMFTYMNKTKYRFELGVDINGNIISEIMFPDFTKNTNSLNIIEPCNAINIVETDERFKGKSIKSVRLQFDQIENSFYWLIEEDGEKKIDPKKIKYEKWYQYVSLNFIVNQSGKITKVTEKKQSVVYCGF